MKECQGGLLYTFVKFEYFYFENKNGGNKKMKLPKNVEERRNW